MAALNNPMPLPCLHCQPRYRQTLTTIERVRTRRSFGMLQPLSDTSNTAQPAAAEHPQGSAGVIPSATSDGGIFQSSSAPAESDISPWGIANEAVRRVGGNGAAGCPLGRTSTFGVVGSSNTWGSFAQPPTHRQQVTGHEFSTISSATGHQTGFAKKF